VQFGVKRLSSFGGVRNQSNPARDVTARILKLTELVDQILLAGPYGRQMERVHVV
jgi:hypothetical protein